MLFYHMQEPFPLYPGECLVGAADDGIKNLSDLLLTLYILITAHSV